MGAGRSIARTAVDAALAGSSFWRERANTTVAPRSTIRLADASRSHWFAAVLETAARIGIGVAAESSDIGAAHAAGGCSAGAIVSLGCIVVAARGVRA